MKFLNFIRFASIITVSLLSLNTVAVHAQGESSNNNLLDEFIASKGFTSSIIFDAANIKQFWVDKTVMAKDGKIVVLLSNRKQEFESFFHKIQLANVDNTLDCRIDVITDAPGLSFSVVNQSSHMISSSVPTEDFIQSHIISSSFHLTDVAGHAFSLKFLSKESDIANINKIILSFSKNKNYLTSPGFLQIGKDDVDIIELKTGIKKDTDDNSTFSITGTTIGVFSKKLIGVSDNVLKSAVTIKNIGDKPTRVYLGYAPYTKDGILITRTVNLYDKQVLKVVSHEEGSKKVLVDFYPEKWERGCHLALSAKEDFSDFPNTNLVKGRILEINKTSDGHAEIVFDKELETVVKTGTLVRIQSPIGASYMYPMEKQLEPGEVINLSSVVQKDDTCLAFNPKSFCKGTDYVVPCVFFESIKSGDKTTVLISDFTVSY